LTDVSEELAASIVRAFAVHCCQTAKTLEVEATSSSEMIITACLST
jgi:hypothetical protein